MCTLKLLICLLASVVVGGCAINRSSVSKVAHTESNNRCECVQTNDILYLLTPKIATGERIFKMKDMMRIDNCEFIREIYSSLNTAPKIHAKYYLLKASRPFVFFNKNNEIICAVLYWPASKPPNMFAFYSAKLIDESVVIGQALDDPKSGHFAVIIDNFDKKISQFIDVWQ